ncbi:MAG TPA: acyl carrier protein [Pirellulales bacterium]|jgi:acyl carrier protein|nr:acyl carrier protein [Pirellulales bacterium]
MDEIEQKVREVVLRVARQRSADVSNVDNGHRLTVELGLTSLDFARIIAILEMELGADPFGRCSAITDMRTVGDLCQAYRAALGKTRENDAAGAFAASESRAAARRSAGTAANGGPVAGSWEEGRGGKGEDGKRVV